MDIGGFLSSISIVAILALIVTVLILLFELRHLFFHKKVTANPDIPDFDGNMHVAPAHATPIDVENIEHGGVNKSLIFILLAVMAVLIGIVVAGFMYGNKKQIKMTPAVQVPTVVPTEIIEIERISPTSPFGEIVEIPFDLSGTPVQVTSTPEITRANSATSSGSVQTYLSPTSITKGGQTVATASAVISQSAQSTITQVHPSLPASGGLSHAILLVVLPFLLVAVAILL